MIAYESYEKISELKYLHAYNIAISTVFLLTCFCFLLWKKYPQFLNNLFPYIYVQLFMTIAKKIIFPHLKIVANYYISGPFNFIRHRSRSRDRQRQRSRSRERRRSRSRDRHKKKHRDSKSDKDRG